MSEQLGPSEAEILSPKEIIASREKGLVESFEKSGIPISTERWHALVPTIEYKNLEELPAMIAAKEKNNGKFPANVHALVDRTGNVAVGEIFFKFNEVQQRHVLAHEASHRLSYFLERSQNKTFAEITERIASLPSAEVSQYVAYIERSYQKRKAAGEETISEERLAQKLAEEKSAEIFAQYLTNEGKFGAMVKSKLLKFGRKEQMTEFLTGPGAKESLAALDKFDGEPPATEEEKEAFFTEHPEFKVHYELFQKIQELLGNEEEMASTFEQGEDNFMDGEFIDYDIMVDPYPILEAPPIAQAKGASAEVKKPAGPNLFNFLFYGAVSS